MIRRQMSALSSFSFLNASIASFRSALSCGRSVSLCGSRFIISRMTLRSLCSGPSDVVGGTDSSKDVNAGRYASKNFGYSLPTFTISIASRISVASASLSFAVFAFTSFFACSAN